MVHPREQYMKFDLLFRLAIPFKNIEHFLLNEFIDFSLLSTRQFFFLLILE